MTVEHFFFIVVYILEEVADTFLIALSVDFVDNIVLDMFGYELACEFFLEIQFEQLFVSFRWILFGYFYTTYELLVELAGRSIVLMVFHFGFELLILFILYLDLLIDFFSLIVIIIFFLFVSVIKISISIVFFFLMLLSEIEEVCFH